MMHPRIFLILFFSLTLNAVQVPHEVTFPNQNKARSPWFTGPLLAPSSITFPPGHFNLEPYIYATANIGHYNKHWHPQKSPTFWNNTVQVSTVIGLSPRLDIPFSPIFSYNTTQGVSDWVIDDFPIGIDIQLVKRTQVLTHWGTALLLRLQEVVPIGKYRNLNPKKLLTDAGGQGSWQTNATLVWGNFFYLGGNSFITWRNALQYSNGTPVHVKNLNVYGGGKGTNGWVYMPQSVQLDTAIEITLSRHWVFAMDVVGNWSQRTRFSGHTTISNSAPASWQFSMAPALEYNWSSHLGLIFGTWFSVTGKNATQFISTVIAFNWFH